jgi:hypothetical protein
MGPAATALQAVAFSAFAIAEAFFLNDRSDITNSFPAGNFRAGDGVHLRAIHLRQLLHTPPYYYPGIILRLAWRQNDH